MEAIHHAEGRTGLDGDLGGGIRAESERRFVYRGGHRGRIHPFARLHGEAPHAITGPGERLQMIEMQPHAVLTACDFRRVCTATRDGGDDDRVAECTSCGGEQHAIADGETGRGGETFVYGDAADVRASVLQRHDRRGRLWCRLLQCRGEREDREDREGEHVLTNYTRGVPVPGTPRV